MLQLALREFQTKDAQNSAFRQVIADHKLPITEVSERAARGGPGDVPAGRRRSRAGRRTSHRRPRPGCAGRQPVQAPAPCSSRLGTSRSPCLGTPRKVPSELVTRTLSALPPSIQLAVSPTAVLGLNVTSPSSTTAAERQAGA